MLASNLGKSETPVVSAILTAENFTSVKNIVTSMVSQLLNTQHNASKLDDSDESDSDITPVIKRSECSMSTLTEWYNQQLDSTRIAILIKDFEMCQLNVLQNFILLLSSYLQTLPIVLAIGIATSISNLHNALPHNIVTKLKVKVFISEASVVFLNNIMDQVFLKPDCSFFLGGRILEYMTEVFLYYNFSIKQFVESLKYCLIEHLYDKPFNCIVIAHSSAQKTLLNSLDENIFKDVVQLRSVNYKLKIDKDFKQNFLKLVQELKNCISDFHIGLRVLQVLVHDLPQTPLGTQLREMYCYAMKKHIVDDQSFKTSIQLLNFLSKDDLLLKFHQISDVLKNVANNKQAKSAFKFVQEYIKNIENSLLSEIVIQKEKLNDTEKPKENLEAISRSQFKRKLIDNLKHEDAKPKTQFEKVRKETLDHLTSNILRPFLIPPTSLPLHELMIFDDLPSVKRKIVGEDRAAQYTALVNPQHYIDCDCCELEFMDQVLPTMPDVCIAYKLHLESRFDQINMYDWLQKFLSVVSTNQCDEKDDNDINPELQARFVKAVNELQYLGYIRPSKYKADHVQRLTCGSC
ncbi:origin recognition complex subunit 3 isoform X2 [Daktulosphaira vitifoliae]|nr:origin recognition complex subunit 3 isoform X2 [Daktulosphaira vitifoliae]